MIHCCCIVWENLRCKTLLDDSWNVIDFEDLPCLGVARIVHDVGALNTRQRAHESIYEDLTFGRILSEELMAEWKP